MFILVVNAHVKPEHIEAFRQATMENARNSRREPGIVRFDFLQQTDDPSRFMLYEVYRTAEDPPRHRETPHYNAWLTQVNDMFVEPRTRMTWSNVSPADADW